MIWSPLSQLVGVLYELQSALFVLVAGSERKKRGSHQLVGTLSVSAVDRPSEDQSTSFFFVLADQSDVVVCALVYLSGNFFLPHDPFRE